jgi:hypothetical protein
MHTDRKRFLQFPLTTNGSRHFQKQTAHVWLSESVVLAGVVCSDNISKNGKVMTGFGDYSAQSQEFHGVPRCEKF